jgi:hypothetical protein
MFGRGPAPARHGEFSGFFASGYICGGIFLQQSRFFDLKKRFSPKMAPAAPAPPFGLAFARPRGCGGA